MRRTYVLIVSALLVLVGLAVTPASSVQDVTHDRVVRENPDNWTPHVLDGEVNALAEVGQWVVVGGSFSQAQEASGGPVLTRNSIMAFNKSTGAISTSFVPQLNGVVKGLAAGPDGTVYVGGNFSSVNGSSAFKITQLRVSDGSRVSAFKPGRTNSIVQDVRFVAGRLFMGGSFTAVQRETRNRLAELDPTTGELLPRTNVSFEGTHFGGNTQIYHMDVSPDGSKLVAIGNFTSVNGQERVEAAMVDIGGATSTVSSWQTDRYEPRCYSVFKYIVRDVEFSPDGSYFVIGTTGGFGPGSPSLCDTATRWESDATGPGQHPTWIDYTGGDSLYSVAVTGSAVYVGGHNRWMNNPSRADAEGPGAVERSGIAALDPVNGVPLSWNPGRTRGQGVFDMLATSEGLFIGSDTERVHGEYHARLAHFSLDGGTPVPQPDPPGLPADVYSLGPVGTTSPVLYRVNAGGGALAALDGGPDWLADNGLTGQYRNLGSNAASWSPIPNVDGTVPSSTPRAIFESERWDPGTLPELQWDFPVAAGTDVEVRLYLSNRCDCTDQVGERSFNVDIDGQRRLSSYDLVADVGDDVGTMKSYDITSDGNVDIDFGHVVENPLVNGIEIVNLDAPQQPPGDGGVKRSFDGSSFGAATPVDSPGIDWSNVRGAAYLDGSLYTAWSDGHLYKRPFDGTSFGAPQDVDLNRLTNFASEMQSMTGMFYENGRLYFTRSGSSRLQMRYFTVESDIVGAGLRDLQPFTVANNLSDVDWTDVRGMFLANDKLYWSDRTDGTLHRLNWVDGAPVAGTDVVVSGPAVDGIDWRQRALFAAQSTPNGATQ